MPWAVCCASDDQSVLVFFPEDNEKKKRKASEKERGQRKTHAHKKKNGLSRRHLRKNHHKQPIITWHTLSSIYRYIRRLHFSCPFPTHAVSRSCSRPSLPKHPPPLTPPHLGPGGELKVDSAAEQDVEVKAHEVVRDENVGVFLLQLLEEERKQGPLVGHGLDGDAGPPPSPPRRRLRGFHLFWYEF